MLARKVNPTVIHAIEVYPESSLRLAEKGVIVHSINIERDPFLFRMVRWI
jgi:hypothetical protein